METIFEKLESVGVNKESIEDFLQYLARPLLIIIIGCLLFNLPTLLYKTRLTGKSILYLMFCNDKSWKVTTDPNKFFEPLMKEDPSKIERKTIYFVRHAESTWNDTFNKGKHRSTLKFVIGFIPGLIKAVLYELYLLLSGKMDSWFYDAPVSFLGLAQVDDLGNFLSKKPAVDDKDGELVAILRGDPGTPPSKILCSSLRRAISTMAAGFRDRLARHPEDKILIVPALQEISRNPDTLSITPPHAQVTASWIDRNSKICDFQQVFSNQVDTSLHNGNKPVKTNGMKRMLEFCDFVFSPSVKEQHVIVGGHSIYFRYFFREFLPRRMEHVGKKKKIVNCGIVAMDLMKTTTKNGKVKYMIDPESVRVVHGGF